MLKLVLVTILLGLVRSGLGQIISNGQCDPNVTVVQDFQVAEYLNRWFLIETYPSDFQNGTCIDATYTLGANGTVDVLNTQVVNQNLDSISGTATAVGTAGTLLVEFPGVPGVSDYWVLATDYISYALVYSCVDITNTTRAVFSWKLSRTRILSAAANIAIVQAINNVEALNNNLYVPVDHSPEGCFYFPDPGASPVRFRATCDQNINVVQNFNATAYEGLWHLIESYPSPFQTGTCNNALYTLGANGVVVVNSQVIDQTLDTITGLAVPASTDGSAILNVTFPGAPEPSPYWVLATDYISYSLVYSCVDLDSESSNVWSWKLSRTRQLTAAAVTAINNVTSGIQVLDDRYYETINQTAAGCFHFPEPQPGVPVEFHGLCDQTISVVPNFNFTRFAGSWYEVEAYPDDRQQGQCVSHEYTAGASGLTVQTLRIANEARVQTSGSLALVDPAGGGRLMLTMTTATGQTMIYPFWIVDTDYDDYALAYSCLDNFITETRLVYTWKFSRSSTLSTTAQTAIANATADIDVIDSRYFESVSHSADSCFYVPDLAPGEPAIFPGQCDQNIAVVQNFNISAYTGLWRLIETYPSESQRGTCLKSEYSEVGNTLTFRNTQIINELQEAFTGTAVAAADGSGRLQVTYGGVTSQYLILATDYTSYALVYNCTNISNEQRRVHAWKFSRERTLSPVAIQSINQVVNSVNVLNDRFFTAVTHSDAACFHYPQFDTLPDVITLPGPCDTSIRGIANFDTAAYQGNWREIEKYPQPSQQGQCARSDYTYASPIALVASYSQVVNRTLLTQSGQIMLATDGSGQLLVSTIVDGVVSVTSYYVLATDYISFALLYSCTNLDNGARRQVGSWKMSRSNTLTADATATINTVIAATQGLNQNYYTTSDQSEAACFYVPAPNPDQAVLFRGSCPNLAGIPNFNMEFYEGWWHHITNYPTGEEIGTCLSTWYRQVGNTWEFEDTQVFGLTGQVSRGTVVVSNNGRLTKTWADGSRVQDIWVLATDYSSYSLLLSCEPVANGYVRVWSSIQSKGRSLSAASETVISNVIANNDFLERDFYVPVNQSDSACFHYPESNGIVILPGQCDQSIPVQPNFDISGYVGTWYQIERYPYPEVAPYSTCIGTRLTSSGSGHVDVLNWEVRNGTLNTIEAHATVADGSAVLETTIGNITASLHILATDYETYSLAYTCDNISPFERVVVAFKLSRGRTLSAEAATAINAVIASREELHQPLFITVHQSEDCDEPNSSFLVQSSIIVVLICYAINMLM